MSAADDLVLQVEGVLQVAVSDTLQQIAREAAQLVKDYTYPNRRKTRESVRAFVRGNSVHCGLYFGSRYTRSTNTFTHRHFAEVWHNDVKPELIRRFPDILNDNLPD